MSDSGERVTLLANYDVVVIGTGSAASSVASRCSGAGKRVAVVDSRPYGGTCALRRSLIRLLT